ncbi:MAG TPA: MFS transporter [Thermomicrobiales bacterium]|nr:MFS transporter [Thermomicrobiales bacterium]
MFATLRQRDFGLLWLAGLVSVAGDFAFVTALPLHVYRLTDSTLATAGTFIAYFLPGVLIGSVAGVFVDRWDRKRTMVVADLARAVVLLPLLVAPDALVAIYAVTAALGTIGPFFGPAEGALLPTLVGEDRLVPANALNSLNDNLGMLLGPAFGALLYAELGIGGVVLVNAASYIGSALLIRLIAADARPARSDRSGEEVAVGSAWTRMVSEWRAGLRVVQHDRTLSVLFVSWSFGGISEGFFLTLGLTPLVLDVLGGEPAQVGWLGTSQAVGGLIAGVVIARFGRRLAARRLFGGGLLGVGIADFGSFNSRRLAGPGTPAVLVSMGWNFLAGFPAVAGSTGNQSLIQTRTVDAYRGRVFGALRAVIGIAMIVGFGLAGVLGDALDLVLVLSVSATIRMLGGIVALALLPREAPDAQPAEPAESRAPVA